jgi:hypothetical protein
MSIQSSESFNDKNYKQKKEENMSLKDEIARLKGEMASLIKTNTMIEMKLRGKKEEFENFGIVSSSFNVQPIKIEQNIDMKASAPELGLENLNLPNANEEMNVKPNTKPNIKELKNNLSVKNEEIQKMQNSQMDEIKSVKSGKSESNCPNCLQTFEKINEFKNNLKSNTFKDVKQFYITYGMDIEKITNKIEEVVTKFTNTDNQFANENQDKKIKVSQVREILSQVQKLISLLSVFIGKYNKDVYYYTTNLKKIFDFVSKLVYSNYFITSFSSLASNKLSLMKSQKHCGIPAENLLKMFYELNGKVFIPSELRKFYVIYENRGILEVVEIFKMNCDAIKASMSDVKFDYESNY